MESTIITEPRIIQPSEHPIKRSLIDNDALWVLRKLNKAGFSSYLVGGGVRDLYLGTRPKDFDISTDARPGQIRKLFTNSRTIGRRFRLVQVFFKKGKVLEVSTLRSLSEHEPEGPAAVLRPNNSFGTLDQDAVRRDLTINGLFYEIESETIIDYVGGVADLDRSLIKMIGDPEKRIQHDPVRMLRVIRHSARNSFAIDPATWNAVTKSSSMLSLCPASRLRDELLKDIYSGYCRQWFDLALQSGVFVELFPLYQDILYDSLKADMSCVEGLRAIFSTIDRMNNRAVAAGRHRQPAFFHLAFILIPWAIARFDLLNLSLKGAQLFQFSKKFRETITSEIGHHLNLQRSVRQEIGALLTFLPLLKKHDAGNSWPKWLRKKSYFANCRLLYLFVREALDREIVPETIEVGSRKPVSSQQGPRTKRRRKKKGRPAFSTSKQTSVFGLKR